MANGSLDTVFFSNLLEMGTSILKMQVRIVSKVYESNYELIAIQDIACEFKVGDVLDLNATYCIDVVNMDKTIAITEIDGVQGLQAHPLYAVRALEAYIGVTIRFNKDVLGTINFSSIVLRPNSFTPAEIALVEANADLVSESLTQ